MAPFSAPGTAESMTQPVYPLGILFDSGDCLGRAVTLSFCFSGAGLLHESGQLSVNRAYRSAGSAQLAGGIH